MGRKAEPGIQYYPMECNHTSHRKIKLLINECGQEAYWIWACLISEAYRTKGYYLDINDTDELDLFSQDVCKTTYTTVKRVIDACLKRGLFNPELHAEYGILTSDRMQENYISATAERRKKGTKIEMVLEFLLVTIPDDLRNILIVPGVNSINPGNKTQSKVEYSKVKESKVEKSKTDTNVSASGTEVPPNEEAEKNKALKTAYNKLEPKDKRSVIEFVRDNKPSFIEPYVDMWNWWAAERGKTQVKAITAKRRDHFRARFKEREFDFLNILTTAAKSPFILHQNNWFDFDWLIKNQDNYTKILEGKYMHELQEEKAPEGQIDEATARLMNSIKEKTDGGQR